MRVLAPGYSASSTGRTSWRTLSGTIELVRPLLAFCRSETAQLCQELDLPIWLDPSNSDPRFSRNRVRHEVLPVLEALHPGASTRISQLSERISQEAEGPVSYTHLRAHET